MIFKVSKPRLLRLLHLFLLLVGVSAGVVATFVLTTFSFPIQIFFFSQHLPPPSNHSLLTSNWTSNPNQINQTSSMDSILMHDMPDDVLLTVASKVVNNNSNPKIAFMFLTPGPLPLSPFWESFFHGHHGYYSIYVHPHPSFNYSFPPSSPFHARRIPTQAVQWGTISMIDAERRLLANALLDPSNRRFVLLSDSCIPVFNFTTVYGYLMGTNRSFVGSFDDPRKSGRGRYNNQMSPAISIDQWRKGSQWFEVHRDLAVKIVADRKYYDLFRQLCLPPCYSDEHYLPTLLNVLFPAMNSNRSVTWVDWSRGGPHPKKFGWIDVNGELLNWIRVGSECEYNGEKTNLCFLFARKFWPSAIRPLMKIGPSILGFTP
ncbi:glycosyltransferase BC10 [Andrographis paniculata]|uniref:glycosyltransferase BC10 n=1 Tax=Andrographis paniculata TaxID=175694 RepID=UPI0021E7FB2B|nr:glycosyltransferase BC10 [Andrographis paniculata]